MILSACMLLFDALPYLITLFDALLYFGKIANKTQKVAKASASMLKHLKHMLTTNIQ
jgi:hypothetical protein